MVFGWIATIFSYLGLLSWIGIIVLLTTHPELEHFANKVSRETGSFIMGAWVIWFFISFFWIFIIAGETGRIWPTKEHFD